MKVLLFTLEYPPFKGGVANVYGNIVKHWSSPVETRCGAFPALTRNMKKTRGSASLRGDIFVLHNNDGKLINNKLPFLKWIPSVWRLWRALKGCPLDKGGWGDFNKIDHILVGHILPLGIAAYLVTRLTKTPYSVFLHGMDFTFALRTPRKRWITKKILNNAQNIICINSYVASLAKNIVSAKAVDKIEVVNPGINKELRITNYELRIKLINKYSLENKIVLLSVGRFVKRKGFDKVLDSLSEVLKELPELVYVIIGYGEELLNYELQIRNYGLDKSVILITDADDEEKNAWYEICDIFIMPSRNIDGDFEGFGIVYLEANLTGKPVIAGDSGGVRDAVEDNVSGLLVNPEDVGEIKDAIIKLSNNKELRERLGEQGRERAVNGFNWDKQVSKIYNLISAEF